MKLLFTQITEDNKYNCKSITEKYYLPLIFSVNLYIESRNEEGNCYKIFVDIKILGISVLFWSYRDEHIRERHLD